MRKNKRKHPKKLKLTKFERRVLELTKIAIHGELEGKKILVSNLKRIIRGKVRHMYAKANPEKQEEKKDALEKFMSILISLLMMDELIALRDTTELVLVTRQNPDKK